MGFFKKDFIIFLIQLDWKNRDEQRIKGICQRAVPSTRAETEYLRGLCQQRPAQGFLGADRRRELRFPTSNLL